MKLGELYVHMYHNALKHIFISNYDTCMTKRRVALWLTIAPYSINKNSNPSLHISRRSSVGNAFGLKSKGCCG